MLSNTCKYAIKAVIYLVLKKDEQRSVKIKEIADNLTIPSPFTGKILQVLARHRILVSEKGRVGGFRVSDNYADYSLLDIVRIIDGTFIFEKCLIGLNVCEGKVANQQHCPLHSQLDPIKERFYLFLKSFKLDKVAEHFTHIEHLLKY